MYEAVHAVPDGRSTVARVAATAADCGFDGVVVRNHGDARADFDPDRVGGAFGIDVVDGVEIRASDPSRASGFLGAHRPHATVVLVHGGTEAINRFAVRQDRVDVLAHPMAGGGDVNHVLARAAADHGVRLEVDLSPVLREAGGDRVEAISDLRTLRELIETYDVPFVVSADPASHLELRAPRDLVAVGEGIGFDPGTIEDGLAEWGRLVDRNRDRMAEGTVEPGVTRGRYGEGP